MRFGSPARSRVIRLLRALLLAPLFVAVVLATATAARAAEFGVEPGSFSTALSGAGAGEHADLTTTFAFNQEPPGNPVGYVKDIGLRLPPGLIGDPHATPLCEMGAVMQAKCPSDTAVGVAEVMIAFPPKFESVQPATALVYNIAPYSNEPAAYAFDASNLPIRLDASLPAEDNYGLRLSATNLSDARPVLSAKITLWGVPADHNGPGPCRVNPETEEEECEAYGGPGEGPRLAFLSNPVECGNPMQSFLAADSWQEAKVPGTPSPDFGPLTGCEGLRFEPSLSASPAEPEAHEPTGYSMVVHLPGGDQGERAAADLKDAHFALPAGTVVSPSAGNGLQSCADSTFKEGTSTPAGCLPPSQIGSVSITTPLLSKPLEGQIYLGEPECGPCNAHDAQSGRMIRLLIEGTGPSVTVKLHGSISIDEVTGRLTALIENSPQLPVEEMKLTFNGGPTALLANPGECGIPLRATAQLTPYSSEVATEADGESFVLTGCQGPRFAPAFEAGTVTNQADGPSTVVVSIARSDHDQALERFTVGLPPGLLGLLSTVPACTQVGACDPSSQIGTVSIAAGPGESPLALKGSVFLTGPHGSSPFGLSIVVPAQAGPIDLGAIDIQAGIQVNPSTAALTISSDALPQSLAGVPLQIRKLNLEISRAGFMVNSTDCRPMAIAATLGSTQGASATATRHYQASGCAKLAFKPHMAALADAGATRLGGAYMHVKLASQPGQANVSKVKLDLPRALPSRLTTLQGACIEATFHANPAGCPASSVVGMGAVTTPFLRALLTGPVYLVSHGGRAFPDLDAVLQGEHVTLMLVGSTAFTNGASSEAFRSLPDAPISTLDLMFPEGPHSAFAANTNLCRGALNMPTEITGQNGAVVKQTIKVAVSGCAGVKHSKLRRKAATR